MRSIKYKIAKQVTTILNSVGFVGGLWILFYPKPYMVLFIINLLLPVIGMSTYIKFKDYVEFDKQRGRHNPNVATVVLIPSIMLSIRATIDFNVIYSRVLWVYLIIITIILLALVLLKSEEYKSKKWLPFFMIIVFFSYVHGAAIISNCIFDNSQPGKYTTYIEDKHISHGRNTSYHLNVRPWGPFLKNQDIKVSKSLYEHTGKGQQLRIFLFEGTWGIQWFQVRT